MEEANWFAEELGGVAAFVEGAGPRPWELEGIKVPIYVAFGRDYERGVSMSDLAIPPVIAWPGLKSLLSGVDAVALHGSKHPANAAYLERLGKPYATLDFPGVKCPARVQPLVLFHGWTYDALVGKLAGCEVGEPLSHLASFVDLARRVVWAYLSGMD